ncbi:Prim-Pol domain-containing protein [Hyphomicrobiales bacterium]|nr:Prim-Pol domain-containing protein [Hyphomicrobiales bacterium]CAH1697145.1 Prim-Pol domain-containing protein [Hyphomicrobiales bacterium]CAI0342713.1 regulatory protein RepA [Hyphomicrobiales bacterium]
MTIYNGASVEAIDLAQNSASAGSDISACTVTALHDQRKLARAFVKTGFSLIPLIDKKPAIKHWKERKASTPDEAERLWSQSVTGDALYYDIGIVTGEGLIVLDIDNKNGKNGAAALERLELRNSDLPATFSVSTPNDGEHRYFYVPPGVYVPNSVEALGDGLDVRGDGGYVVAPWTRTGDRAYEVRQNLPIAPAPPWLINRLSKPKPAERPVAAPTIDLDLPEAIAAATKWLQRHAELAVEGAGGDATTIRVANRVLDHGVSVDAALELMLDHWNERCSPPWDADELRRKVENAERYRQAPVGVASPELEFDDVSDEVQQKGMPGADPSKERRDGTVADFPSASPADLSDPRAIPKRNWIVGGLLSSTFLTGVIAPGGTGKTNFALALALSIVTGRSEISGFPIKERTKAWYWNQEDDKDELRRRLAATAQLHRVATDDLLLDGRPALFLDSGVDQPLMLVSRGPGGKLVPTPAVDAVIQRIRTNQIGVWIVDPLVEFHEADENNNPEMALVWRTIRRIAVEANCAVMVVAHTRKPLGASAEGHTGDVNSLRGAGAQAGVMRLAVTLSTMTAKEAAALKVPAGQKGRFVKVEGAKHNLTTKDAAPVWFENTGVVIANGEEVGAMRPANFGLLAQARPPLGDRAEALLAAFWSALRRKGPFETTLTTEEWEAEARPIWAGSGSSDSKVRENIRKCRSSLEEKGIITKTKQNQWLANYPEEPEEPEISV